jgi:GNAT superfamily N-acetyltransferase
VVAIRRAGVDDVSALARLHLDTVTVAYRDFFPRDSTPPAIDELVAVWSRDVEDAHAVFVVEDAGRSVIGSAVARVNGDLARLHVHPDSWGRGIGGALHDAAVDALRAAGHGRAELWVIDANARARGLYERRGWHLDPTRTLDYVGVTEVRYVLELGS